jgi:hypothetical protein
MTRFLIEVPHSDNKVDCLLAIQAFLNSGSHFLANADWGCLDGEHKAWFILEAENKEEARWVLPPSLRPGAKIVALSRFKSEEIDEMLAQHTN